MDRQLKYDRTTTTIKPETFTIKPETLTIKISDLSHFKFALSDEDIEAYKKSGNLMMDVVKTGGEAMARAIGNTYSGNFGVGTDEACRMISSVSSKTAKDINKDLNNFLLEMIEATVSQEPHLGDNLKQQCLDYLKEIKEREKKEGRL